MFVNPAIVTAVGSLLLTNAPLQKCDTLFASHVAQYALEFPVEDFSKRMEIFCDNLEFIDTHNARNKTYTLGLNAFAHLTHEEFLNTYTTSAFTRPVSGVRSARPCHARVCVRRAQSVLPLPSIGSRKEP